MLTLLKGKVIAKLKLLITSQLEAEQKVTQRKDLYHEKYQGMNAKIQQ